MIAVMYNGSLGEYPAELRGLFNTQADADEALAAAIERGFIPQDEIHCYETHEFVVGHLIL